MPALIRLRIDGEGNQWICVGFLMHSHMMMKKRRLQDSIDIFCRSQYGFTVLRQSDPVRRKSKE
jgi:hypothetical protein